MAFRLFQYISCAVVVGVVTVSVVVAAVNGLCFVYADDIYGCCGVFNIGDDGSGTIEVNRFGSFRIRSIHCCSSGLVG